MPRFRLRTMMIVVAVVALLLAVLPPWWRNWFGSPWRTLTYRESNRSRTNTTTILYNVDMPGHERQMTQLMRDLDLNGIKFKTQRFSRKPF